MKLYTNKVLVAYALVGNGLSSQKFEAIGQ